MTQLCWERTNKQHYDFILKTKNTRFISPCNCCGTLRCCPWGLFRLCILIAGRKYPHRSQESRTMIYSPSSSDTKLAVWLNTWSWADRCQWQQSQQGKQTPGDLTENTRAWIWALNTSPWAWKCFIWVTSGGHVDGCLMHAQKHPDANYSGFAVLCLLLCFLQSPWPIQRVNAVLCVCVCVCVCVSNQGEHTVLLDCRANQSHATGDKEQVVLLSWFVGQALESWSHFSFSRWKPSGENQLFHMETHRARCVWLAVCHLLHPAFLAITENHYG